MFDKKHLSFFYIFSLLLLLIFPTKLSSGISSNRLENIPDSIISLSSGYVIVVDKQYQKLYVFKKSGIINKVFEVSCSTGKNQGAKQIAGDSKTPNGIYFATKILRNPGQPEIYGTLAFPLDYPSLSDRRAGRNGNNIWIHGTTKPLTPMQSSGCVVLRDNDIHRLIDIIYFNKTPVIIQESIHWISQNQIPHGKQDLERVLTLWNKYSMETDMKSFDALYLPGAEVKGKKREDILRKFRSLKVSSNHFDLEPHDVSILRQENTAVILFDQIVNINTDNSFQGTYNKLALEKLNNRWYIVDDISSTVVSNGANSAKTVARRTVVKEEPKIENNISKNATGEKEITALITKWAGSWKSGDMRKFRNCYAANFKSRNMNLNGWISHKVDVRKNSKNINVRVENIHVMVNSTNATAAFTQYYSSSILKSKSSKKLELKKMDNEWKIVRETI